MEAESRVYIVANVAIEAPGVATLRLSPAEGALPPFMPGQFVNIALPEAGAEQKSYSIASTPEDPHLALTVRDAGRTSHALCLLGAGDRLSLSAPCGFFHPEDGATPRIFVAGGIGIVPLMSILRSGFARGEFPPTLLLYSNRTESDIVHRAELDRMARHGGAFSTRYFITRSEAPAAPAIAGRIGTEALSSALSALPGAHWFLCGSIPFVRDMRTALKDMDVPEERMFTESFF